MNFDKFELIDDLVDIAINEDLKNLSLIHI